LFIDVGANCGQWLVAMKRVFPTARVICYEPDPRAFVRLKEIARAFSDVECVACALDRAAGEAQLFRNADSVTSSLLPSAAAASIPYAEKLLPLDTVQIDVRTLASELARRGIERVELLKTDCQGLDLRVLEGAGERVASGAFDLIVTEAMFQQEYSEQGWFDELLPWLRNRGYALVGIYDVLHDANGRAMFGDALFRRIER
jgi:FkbM family methyltransferase